MKLGIVADEIDRDFAQAVRVGKSAGLLRYEIRNLVTGRAPMCDIAELQEVARIAEREDVEITALSPGLFKYTEDEQGFARQMAEVYPRAAEWAHRWKLPGFIVFGFHKPGATEENVGSLPHKPAPDGIIEWMARAGERAAADGLLLMIEPEPICWVDSSRVAAALIERTGSQALRINYDPGNVAWLEQRDPISEFNAASHWIANVHVKDLLPSNDASNRPDFVPAGEGIVDFRAHFAALHRIAYSGPISLEPHMDGSVETIVKCKQAFDRLWA